MERYDSIEPFGFEVDLLGLTRIPNTVNKLAVNASQRIITPFFRHPLHLCSCRSMFVCCFIHSEK